MKVKVISGRYCDVTTGNVYQVVNEYSDDTYEIVDDIGDLEYVLKKDCEVIKETFTPQDLKKGTIDFLYNDKGSSEITFENLQQYASELNIGITFLPENKVAVYIDNTLDKTYTVETEDELEELVKALRLVDKYLDKD